MPERKHTGLTDGSTLDLLKENNMEKYMNHKGCVDITPYEVVKICTNRKCIVRSMECNVKSQQSQEWSIYPDPKGVIFELRMHKDGIWYSHDGRQFVNQDKPKKFFDYNVR